MTTEDVTVLVHLVGEVNGVVMYGMPSSTGIKFVSEILGQEFSEMTSLAQSGVAELGNVISGRATVKFSQAGFEADISTPMVITGKGVQVSTLDFPRIVVPVTTNLGNMTVHLALRENKDGVGGAKEQFVSLIVSPGSNAPVSEA